MAGDGGLVGSLPGVFWLFEERERGAGQMISNVRRMGHACGALTLWLVCAIAPAPAEMIEAQKVVNGVRVYDVIVNYPPASWVTGRIDTAEVLNLSEYWKNQNGPQFVIEQIPKGEAFEAWSKIYAVSGLHLDQSKGSVPLAAFVRASIAPFAQVCGPSNIKLDVKEEAAADVTLVIFCTAMPGAGKVPGYDDGMAEIGLFRFLKAKNTFVKVYQEWRGKPFAVDDTATWPVSQDELGMMIERFKAIELLPASPP